MADLKITDLGSASTVDESDFFVVDTGIDTLKATGATVRKALVGDISQLRTTASSDVVDAINEVDAHTDANTEAVVKCECLVLSSAGVSSLPITINNDAVETDMVCINATLSNPGAQISDWTVNTNTAGVCTISGSINGTTDITLYLMKSR
jgi:hypothetical protein